MGGRGKPMLRSPGAGLPSELEIMLYLRGGICKMVGFGIGYYAIPDGKYAVATTGVRKTSVT